MEEYNDKLHELIKVRLAERGRKSQSIKTWTKRKEHVLLRPMIGVAIAACMIGAFFLIPGQIASDESEGVRSASENIEELLQQGRYEEALTIVDRELQISDSTLHALQQDSTLLNDDETEYLIEATRHTISDLREQRKEILKKNNK